ncbi:MAG: hypothetical protein GF416_08145 [Candidatus Altiarchaeales archaeon]|nr:hypothetical protein [Candidatus Altiarchaeales archaeon]MBD3417085.1 hypothetical protein [Candidatus Altiarchaeales archaeon]
MNVRRIALGFLALSVIAQPAAAANAAELIASVICGLVPEVIRLARWLAVLMFVYGGAKYAYSADDPGGRKAARAIAINGIVGFLIVGLAKDLVDAIAGATICP